MFVLVFCSDPSHSDDASRWRMLVDGPYEREDEARTVVVELLMSVPDDEYLYSTLLEVADARGYYGIGWSHVDDDLYEWRVAGPCAREGDVAARIATDYAYRIVSLYDSSTNS